MCAGEQEEDGHEQSINPQLPTRWPWLLGQQEGNGWPRGLPELPVPFVSRSPWLRGPRLSPATFHIQVRTVAPALAGASAARADSLPPPLADKRAFFIICTSELGPPQIYELVALTSSDKNT